MHKKIFPNMDALCSSAAHDFVRLINSTIEQKGAAHIFLAGGGTPKRFYQLLATPAFIKAIPWSKVHVYFGDERNVPPDSPESNYNMANTAFLRKINIDPTRIHRIQGELDAHTAATAYNTKLKYCLPNGPTGQPTADLVILGLGDDGHTASLFPDTDILDNYTDLVAAVWVEKFHTWRVSVTYPVINNANNVWVFVSGVSKKDIVDRIFNYSRPERFPIEGIEPVGAYTWYLDEAAADRIDR